MKEKRASLLLFFGALALVYGSIFLLLCRTPLYDFTSTRGAHNDFLFSSDDVYYVSSFFSTTMDTSLRVIKHPLLVVIGWLCTCAEQLVLGGISLKRHYELIVMVQLCISLLSTFYLYRILEEHYKLERRWALLLCAIYALAFSTLFFTFIAEHFILSALLLIMSFYYAKSRKTWLLVLLGALTAGITITNAALWAAIVWFSGEPTAADRRRRMLTLFLGGACFCVMVALSPARTIFFQNIIDGGMNSFHSYGDHYGFWDSVRRTFFAFFGSTFFYLDTAAASPFGDFAGHALSFLPSASAPITAAMVLWVILLGWGAVQGRRNQLLWVPLAVLLCNLTLHGLFQYGLKEGFLYSLHHLPAQLLIAALALRPDTEPRLRLAAGRALAVFLACVILLNLPGYGTLAQFILGK